MNNLEKIDIEQLLAEKPFDALSTKEQFAVLDQLPAAEYDRLHLLLQRSKTALKNAPKPSPALRQNLLNAMRLQAQPSQKPVGLFVRMASYRMPVWQAAAGVALLLGAYFLLQKPTPASVQTETVYVQNTDTIYKQVALPVVDTSEKSPVRPRVNVKPRLLRSDKTTSAEQPAWADSSFARHRNFQDIPDTLPGFRLSIQPANGRSANQDPDLWGLLGKVF